MSADARDRAFKLYRAPFRFEHGYIWDADNEMVADDHVGHAAEINPDVAPAARVRGWGRIGYLPEAEATQDAVGALFAEALTKLWREHFKRPAIVDGGNPHEAVCDSLTYATDDVYQEFARALAAAEAQRDEALAEVKRLRSALVQIATSGCEGDDEHELCGDFCVDHEPCACWPHRTARMLRTASAPPPAGTGT